MPPDAMTAAEARGRMVEIRSPDRAVQNAAFQALMTASELPVAWSYELWPKLVTMLGDRNNRVRAIAAQLLCNLAGSDPEERILVDLEALLAVTRDERFVTARHCLQSLWKVGAAGERQRQAVVRALERRFAECAAERNHTLIRFDIVVAMWRIHGVSHEPDVREAAMALIASEDDSKYRKKYAAVWKS